jgi:site-specific recombinase XerD
MGVNLKFIFRASRTADSNHEVGYIYLRKTINRKVTYKSIGLPLIDKRVWDETKQRVKKHKSVNADDFNRALEDILTEERILGGESPILRKDPETTSFLDYIKKTLKSDNLKNKHGTRIKYHSVLRKLEGFLHSQKKEDLLFKEVTVDFLYGFQSYMVETKMSQNSATHYLKVLQTFIVKSMKDRRLMITYNPFQNFNFEKKEVRLKETLNDEDIKFLLTTSIPNPHLDIVRNMFLFQFFAGGMRVSDLLSLRFRNLTHGKLSYRMLKTGHPMEFQLSETLLEIIARSVSFQNLPGAFSREDPLRIELKNKQSEYALQSKAKDLINKGNPFHLPSRALKTPPPFCFLEKHHFAHYPVFPLNILKAPVEGYVLSMSLQELKETREEVRSYLDRRGRSRLGGGTLVGDGLYETTHPLLERFLELIVLRMESINDETYIYIREALHSLGTDPTTKNNFVFKRLVEKEFITVIDQDNFTNISQELYQKLHSAGVIYNRNLKELQTFLGIQKTLKTHLPRTSFTNIMMRGKVNHRDISNTLGHSTISITDEYLKTGFTNEGVNSVIQRTSEDFKNPTN